MADINNQDSVDNMVNQCRVLISTVGPFWEHGIPIGNSTHVNIFNGKKVDACARLGTHYLDSTGETHFIKQIIELYHYVAAKNNVVIVPSCAFEALLPDLATFL